MTNPELLINLRQCTSKIRKLSYDIDSSISLGHQQIDIETYLKDYQKLSLEFNNLNSLVEQLNVNKT